MTLPLFRADPHDAAERRALVALSLVPGVGPGRIRLLLARFGAASDVLAAPARALATVPGIGVQTAAAIARFDDEGEVERQFARAEATGATMLTAWDDAFPRLLRETFDPPAFLWVRGRLDDRDASSVAVVGTRRATEYGRRTAYHFAAGLAEAGYTIVSGLAHGIDAAAHRGALEAGGRTIAVLGSGVDRIYPARHAALAREIERAGAVLSEYAMGAAPDAPNFPRRNRIVSGLARGTLVVEAYETGGALITARLALEQNREVFAVPSPIHSPAGAGANTLIQRGYAKLVSRVEDVLEELEPAVGVSGTALPETPASLAPGEAQLLAVLGPEPMPIDAVCSASGMDPASALVHLLGLEFKGLVHQLGGQQFLRSR